MPSPPKSRYRAFEVFLDDRQRHALTLRRAPLYLRFTLVGDDWKTLDALDQLDDEPKPTERMIAALKGECNPCHIRYTDRSKSGWYLWVKYNSVSPQPPQEVMRDSERWRDWCREKQRERDQESRPAGPGGSEAEGGTGAG